MADESVVMTPEQQADTGKAVADLKTLLHDTENKISNNQVNTIDWHDLRSRLQSLLKDVNTIIGEPDRPPTHSPSPVPRPLHLPAHKKGPK